MDIPLNTMLDFLVEAQFNDVFTKKDIETMSPLEILQKKMSIRNTFIDNFDIEVLEKPYIFRTNFNKYVVTGEFYPDNYINGEEISNK